MSEPGPSRPAPTTRRGYVRPAESRRRAVALERGFRGLCASAVVIPILLLAVWVGEGVGRLEFSFGAAASGLDGELSGLWAAVRASATLVSLTALFAVPTGVGAAIYLEEYADRRSSGVSRLLEANIANLAGMPSVLYGLLGLELFARALGMGRSLLVGALTVALLILPLVITAARQALRTVPQTVREAGLALGAARSQVIRQLVLPIALPGILAGAIRAIARALGEAAPLLVLGALVVGEFGASTPDPQVDPQAPSAVLPVRIFEWVVEPQRVLYSDAAAGIVVLLVGVLMLNGVAILVGARAKSRTGRHG